MLGKEMEELWVVRRCVQSPNSIPRRLPALVTGGPVNKTEQLQLPYCQPPTASSVNHFSSMFSCSGSLCVLKCVKLPWADSHVRPVSAWEPQWARSSHDSWCSFCPKQAKEWAWRGVCFLPSPLHWPFLSLPFQMNGVTCVPSARPAVGTRDLLLPAAGDLADLPEPRVTGGMAASTKPASVMFQNCTGVCMGISESFGLKKKLL